MKISEFFLSIFDSVAKDKDEQAVSFSTTKPIPPSIPDDSTVQTLTIPLDLPKRAKPLEMVLIQPGTFMMGSLSKDPDRDKNEGPKHKVTLTKAYYIGKYLVTQAQWQAVMGSNPSSWKGINLPVEQVSWKDCKAFIKILNQSGQGTFRLPTEAEWEYACRAGTTTRFYWGDDLKYTKINDYAWYASNSDYKTHDVASKKPNAWGLYDMSGNVWELCLDRYGDYNSSSQIDPTGAGGISNCAIRGGSWNYDANLCRSAVRSSESIRFSYYYIGFRLLRLCD